jgi:hypothetical protein
VERLVLRRPGRRRRGDECDDNKQQGEDTHS